MTYEEAVANLLEVAGDYTSIINLHNIEDRQRKVSSRNCRKEKLPTVSRSGVHKENGAQGIRTPLLRFPFQDLNTIETKCTPNLAG